jgi:hypothetical protein
MRVAKDPTATLDVSELIAEIAANSSAAQISMGKEIRSPHGALTPGGSNAKLKKSYSTSSLGGSFSPSNSNGNTPTSRVRSMLARQASGKLGAGGATAQQSEPPILGAISGSSENASQCMKNVHLYVLPTSERRATKQERKKTSKSIFDSALEELEEVRARSSELCGSSVRVSECECVWSGVNGVDCVDSAVHLQLCVNACGGSLNRE